MIIDPLIIRQPSGSVDCRQSIAKCDSDSIWLASIGQKWNAVIISVDLSIVIKYHVARSQQEPRPDQRGRADGMVRLRLEKNVSTNAIAGSTDDGIGCMLICFREIPA